MDGSCATHIGILQEQLATLQQAPLEYKAHPMRIPFGVSQDVEEAYREKAAAMKRDQQLDRQRELDGVAAELLRYQELASLIRRTAGNRPPLTDPLSHSCCCRCHRDAGIGVLCAQGGQEAEATSTG